MSNNWRMIYGGSSIEGMRKYFTPGKIYTVVNGMFNSDIENEVINTRSNSFEEWKENTKDNYTWHKIHDEGENIEIEEPTKYSKEFKMGAVIKLDSRFGYDLTVPLMKTDLSQGTRTFYVNLITGNLIDIADDCEVIPINFIVDTNMFE